MCPSRLSQLGGTVVNESHTAGKQRSSKRRARQERGGTHS